ncbi:hypothetical protein P154DRAFT_301333 [Amniculicola lignicola CBS 123094]|uniref:Uncharacterized protein n=1 Tax=Amniculicola lignicola CBS 123094 TaxID=1392246 RepID=A0A6A5W750_9PLEO|nr:hypothetical protein P154DRAFT_301333 [Amniculicola lignicola CBS 123094]
MAPNDDPRRDHDRPEDNPFIAFRRFADSQVSSLLNTVFTLPATLNNFSNAHQAREQCLFGKAHPAKCAKLQQIEDDEAKLRAEGRELYRVGDLQAVLDKAEKLMMLDREADALRREIVDEGKKTDVGVVEDAQKQKELVERVGHEKGQQFGWSWSWGFPTPLDKDERERAEDDEDASRHKGCRRIGWRQRREEARERAQERWEQNRDEARKRAEDRWEHFNTRWEEVKRKMNEERPRAEDNAWTVSRTTQPPPPTHQAVQQKESASKQPQTLFDELGNMIVDEVTRMMMPQTFTFRNDSYSLRSLEQDEQLGNAGVQWRDAFEDLVRAERGASLIPQDQLGQSNRLDYNRWARRFWEPEFTRGTAIPSGRERNQKRVAWEGEETNEEPNYEYAHDHEDQHDDPPTPKIKQGSFGDGPVTELDAYERLLDPKNAPVQPVAAERSSILSTLTTTERTVAPDGTMTTKVVLKKRFTDGTEESSETVHTQRGQDRNAEALDPWKAFQNAQKPTPQPSEDKRRAENKSGWFWSK